MATEQKITSLLESHKRNISSCDAEIAQISADIADVIRRRGAVTSEQLDAYMARIRRAENSRQTSVIMVHTLDLLNKLG